jgi:hypothetical protein
MGVGPDFCVESAQLRRRGCLCGSRGSHIRRAVGSAV